MPRTALVTGGTGGLGRAVVAALHAAGYDVHIPAIHEADRAAYVASGGLGSASVVDLRDLDALRAWVASFAGDGLHAAVLCAGGFTMQPISDLSASAVDHLLDINVRTAAHTLAAVGPHLAPGAGVALVGAQTWEGAAGVALYAATKAAVVSLARGAAAEWRPRKIRVNAVLPDIIDTPANRRAMPDADFDRWAKPEELGETIAWLCGDGAKIVTGNAIKVGRP